MSTFLVLCPTHRDHRELALLDGCRAHTFFLHDYATTQLEEMMSPCSSLVEVANVEEELERILCKYRGARIDGVLSTDDYPGSALASIVARNLGLPGVDPKINIVCQHKYHSRVAQHQALPDVVPQFALLGAKSQSKVRFPAFIKPVKSCFSVGAYRVDDIKQLRVLEARARLPERFFAPFHTLFEEHAGMPFGDGRVVIEDLLKGQQVTLEGYACAGDVHVVGIVDSVMFPGTTVFRQFEYPSRLSPEVQARMANAATTVMRGIGFNHGQFNIEFMYNPAKDWVHIIEINPRMASQFADLYEKVDGVNTYSVLLDLALGKRPPPWRRGQGRHAVAVSYALRRTRDGHVAKVPSREDLEAIAKWLPDVRVEVLATEGRLLSQELQDGQSYRYGILSVGGRDLRDVAELVERCERSLPFVITDAEHQTSDKGSISVKSVNETPQRPQRVLADESRVAGHP